MPKKLSDSEKTLKRIASNQTSLDMLMEFERTLDNANLYAYENWLQGEIVDGPHISRYWFEVTLMYHHEEMPNPRGGLRLIKHGCKVYFKKDILLEPTKNKGPGSHIDPDEKRTKLEKIPVWLVTIVMPRKFIDDGLEEYFEDEHEIEQFNQTNIDTSSDNPAEDLTGDENEEA